MTAGKQVCPGEAILGRGVTAVQQLLNDLYCPEVEGGMKLLSNSTTGFSPTTVLTWPQWVVISPHRPGRAGAWAKAIPLYDPEWNNNAELVASVWLWSSLFCQGVLLPTAVQPFFYSQSWSYGRNPKSSHQCRTCLYLLHTPGRYSWKYSHSWGWWCFCKGGWDTCSRCSNKSPRERGITASAAIPIIKIQRGWHRDTKGKIHKHHSQGPKSYRMTHKDKLSHSWVTAWRTPALLNCLSCICTNSCPELCWLHSVRWSLCALGSTSRALQSPSIFMFLAFSDLQCHGEARGRAGNYSRFPSVTPFFESLLTSPVGLCKLTGIKLSLCGRACMALHV